MTETPRETREPRWFERSAFWWLGGIGASLVLGGALVCWHSVPAGPRPLAHRAPVEHGVRRIVLSGPLSSPEAEISGLAWHGDDLLLLPQFPGRHLRDGRPSAFKLNRQELAAYVNDPNAVPLAPRAVTWDDSVSASIDGFDGFEAIAFHGDLVFVAVESDGPEGTVGHLLRGRSDPALERIVIDGAPRAELPAQADVPNLAYEAITVNDGSVYAFYEINAYRNERPQVHIFDLELRPKGAASVSPLEYRITDATSAEQGRFWVSNVFWPGSNWQPGSCRIKERFGLGATHQKSKSVERLLELEITKEGVRPVDSAPVQFRLEGEGARNWEGLARFADGFLVVTDEHPETVLAYVSARD